MNCTITIAHTFPPAPATKRTFSFLLGWAMAIWLALPAQARDAVTIVEVQPGQTLNAAIADVEGPIMILLPPGVTEHDAAITRNETIIIKGQGMNITTLRPAKSLGPDEGVALVTHSAGFDGDFILEDLTYDRAHQPGITLNPDVATGAEIFRVYARNRVEFRNVAIHHFDYGAREDESNAGTPFVFSRELHWRRAADETETRTKDFIFRNVHIDFEKGGGIRHRPGGQHNTFGIGSVDRIFIDGDTVFRSHLCQDANPEYTVGPVWRNRGNAGPMYGLRLWVHERALIDGVWHNSDYGAWRTGGPAHPDAVIEWRMDLLNAGYGDQFWQGKVVEGGHMIFKDVRLEGNRTGKLWNDYGLRVEGGWKTITVDGCTVINRGHPLSIVNHHNDAFQTIDQITIRNTTLVPVAGGGGPGLVIGDYENVGSIVIDGLHVYGDIEAPSEQRFFNRAIRITEIGPGGGRVVLNNVVADGYMYEIFNDGTGPETTVTMHNVQGRQVEIDSLVAFAEPIAVYPFRNRSFRIDGVPEPLDWDPVATIENFRGVDRGPRADPFERLDVWIGFDTGPGVFVRVIVGGVEPYRNPNAWPNRLYRGDGLQFFITRGRPGEEVGGTVWDIAKHDDQGLTAYRYNFWPDWDVPPQSVVDIPMAIEYDPETREIVYEFMLPWEEINMPAPWYEDISVSMIVADSRAYAGGVWFGAPWWHTHGEGIGHAIFHPESPRSRGANWIRFGEE